MLSMTTTLGARTKQTVRHAGALRYRELSGIIEGGNPITTTILLGAFAGSIFAIIKLYGKD